VDHPFTTDGCSGGMTAGWQFISHKPPPWNDCCVTHDKAYWAGGSSAQRKQADITLLIDVANRGYPLIAMLMYLAVRVGGVPWLPLPWRWGYGWKWARGYQLEKNQ
jgi:hypothetical protein